uniref:F-box domain-containing protein n=1 Tax=Moniliophthora roreri TaxID=221103 RepID=A0A0W0GEB1_MONRR
MPSRPSKAFFKEPIAQKPAFNRDQRKSDQYGLNRIPAENLTHITAYLDPRSLFALSGVNKFLHEHVKDDHTWRRAFLLNFLGLKPESDLDASSGLLLRRFESSWMKEYVVRYNIRRRWESPRNSTISYPVHHPISDIHLLASPPNSLLCSSLQYGIVSRAFLLQGKVLRGFLSPSPSGTGLGIGNPNTEFAPDVSACSMTSDGGTAKIAWGFRNGEIAIMTAPRTMDTKTRSAAKLVRCKVEDQHDEEVLQVAWDASGTVICSAAKDGRAKVWDAKTARCLWASDYLVPDIPVKTCIDASNGCVVVAMRSGDIYTWTGLNLSRDGNQSGRGRKVRVSCPVEGAQPSLAFTISSLHLDAQNDRDITIIVAYEGQPVFYCVGLDAQTSQFKICKYSDSAFVGAITSILPCLSSKADEHSFIISGSQLGWVSIYSYLGSGRPATATPLRNFEAHPDASGVTALAWNGVTLVTGSANGSANVFDAYTFERLRVFEKPIPRPRGGHALDLAEGVKQILLSPEKDVLAASVGHMVIGFKADLVPKSRVNQKVSRKKARGTITTKGYEQHALEQLISDSLYEHDQESEYRRRMYGTERQQRENLDRLGLNEVEAVEYILMLSRDEALEREREQTRNAMIEEGVFEGDFDDVLQSRSDPSGISLPSRTPSSDSLSASPLKTSSFSSSATPSRPIHSPPRCSPSSSNEKVQVSPPSREEPREAGWGESSDTGSISAPLSSVSSSMARSGADGDTGAHFPPITPPGSVSPNVPSSSRYSTGAWGGSPSPSRTKGVRGSPLATGTSGHGRLDSNKIGWSVGDDEDEDLKLGIQLSLEEARLRGEVL